MKKTETTDLKWIGGREVLGGVGLRLIGGLGVRLSGSAGGSVTSSFGGSDVEDRGPAKLKQRGESLREWAWEKVRQRDESFRVSWEWHCEAIYVWIAFLFGLPFCGTRLPSLTFFSFCFFLKSNACCTVYETWIVLFLSPTRVVLFIKHEQYKPVNKQ